MTSIFISVTKHHVGEHQGLNDDNSWYHG